MNDGLFNDSLRKLIAITSKHRLVILCSDQNYDLLKQHVHKPTQNFLSCIYENQFIPTMLKLTRVTHSTGTLIDNIYVKNKTVNKHVSYIITDGMSDHYPCLLRYELCKAVSKQNDILIEKRNLNDEAIAKVQQDLLFFDWSPIRYMDVNESYGFLLKAIMQVIDRHAPCKVIKIRSCDKFIEPWLTVKLRKYNSKCRKLCNKARTTGEQSDYIKYKQYRNIVNRVKNYEKRLHYDTLFKKIGKNSQLLWNIVNNLVKKANNKSEISDILYKDRNLTDRKSICTAFNEHFSTAGVKVKNSIVSTAGSLANRLDLVKHVTNVMILSPVSELQICNIVSKLKPKKSSGYDDISNALLQKIIHVIKVPLCIIFNKSIVTGEFPDLMKIAKVIPPTRVDPETLLITTEPFHYYQ